MQCEHVSSESVVQTQWEHQLKWHFSKALLCATDVHCADRRCQKYFQPEENV